MSGSASPLRRYAGKEDLPQVGDIISSKQFAKGAWSKVSANGPTGTIQINSRVQSRSYELTVEDRLCIAAATGDRDPPTWISPNVVADDPTRATARFLVVLAWRDGGYDHYPTTWRIVARRLDDSNNIVEGPAIELCVDDGNVFSWFVPPTEIFYYGTMPVPPEAAQNIR
ncbi:hypothetical protein KBB27_00055 [Patescibacteria group bacterium]|nr:hypothetical protein [Patescibacteria group bacterium]